MRTTDRIHDLWEHLSAEDRRELLAEVGQLGMTDAQTARLRAGDIERMRIGVFRCVDPLSEEDGCGYEDLWEAPAEGCDEVTCPVCTRPAVLVEIVAR